MNWRPFGVKWGDWGFICRISFWLKFHLAWYAMPYVRHACLPACHDPIHFNLTSQMHVSVYILFRCVHIISNQPHLCELLEMCCTLSTLQPFSFVFLCTHTHTQTHTFQMVLAFWLTLVTLDYLFGFLFAFVRFSVTFSHCSSLSLSSLIDVFSYPDVLSFVKCQNETSRNGLRHVFFFMCMDCWFQVICELYVV